MPDTVIYARCSRKVYYPTKRKAQQVAKLQQQTLNEKVHPYKCELCQGWHLGHRPHWRALERMRRGDEAAS